MVIGRTGHKVNADSNVVKEYSALTFLPQRFVLVNADSNVVKEYSAGEVRTGPRHRKASYYEITATPETTETWMR